MINFEYYGIFLDEKEREHLLQTAKDLVDWEKKWEEYKVYADHCTLIHRSEDNWTVVPFLDLFLGRQVEFDVIGYGESDEAFALLVNLPSMNDVSHITIACRKDIPPVASNYIADWKYFGKCDIHSFSGYLGVREHHIR